MKTCVYINLDAAERRRRAVEASFARAAPQGWSLQRFAALAPADVADLPGRLSDAEKGCFASHRAALGKALDDEADLFVAEDDIVFSRQAFGVVGGFLGRGGDWDVLLADVALCDLSLMIHLARARDGMVGRGEYTLVDLARRSWFGATAYAVRGASKRKLHDLLSADSALDQPYDLKLRELGQAGAIRIAACFPFVTTVAAEADRSQIQQAPHAFFDQTLNAYRRLMYVERDLDQCRRDNARLRAQCDEPSALVGDIFAAMVTPAFPLDR